MSVSFSLGPIQIVVAHAQELHGPDPTFLDDLSAGASDALAVKVYDSDTEAVLMLALVAPRASGSIPGVRIAYIPSTGLLFVGAGETLSAYDLAPPRRLWVYAPELGVHELRVHGDIVVVTAELELAAWDAAGVQLWTRFVEPPWGYEVIDGVVHLDIMGELSSFPLRAGPG